MANFNVPSPVELVSSELLVQGSANFSHATVAKPVIGTGINSFVGNTVFTPSGFGFAADGMTFNITAPTAVVPIKTRPTVGQVYPR